MSDLPLKSHALLNEIFQVCGLLQRCDERLPEVSVERLKTAFWALRNGAPEATARDLIDGDPIALRLFDSAMRRPTPVEKPVDRRQMEVGMRAA